MEYDWFQIANIHWIIEKAREFQKNICLCFINDLKAFHCVDHKKLWKILKEMGLPDLLNCLLRGLYVGKEAIVRTRHGTMEWFKTGKGICQGCILSHPAYLTSMQSTSCKIPGWMNEAQAGIKIARRNINNLRYADDTTLKSLKVTQKAKKNKRASWWRWKRKVKKLA